MKIFLDFSENFYERIYLIKIFLKIPQFFSSFLKFLEILQLVKIFTHFLLSVFPNFFFLISATFYQKFSGNFQKFLLSLCKVSEIYLPKLHHNLLKIRTKCR